MTKPNMRFNTDTRGDSGVQSAAMQAAKIKADAQSDNGMSSLANNLINEAMRMQKEAKIDERLQQKRGWQVEDKAVANEREDKRYARQDVAAASKAQADAQYKGEQLRLSQERNDIAKMKANKPTASSSKVSSCIVIQMVLLYLRVT